MLQASNRQALFRLPAAEMDDIQPLFTQASQAMQQGKKIQAKAMLDLIISRQPGSEQAWLLLSEVVEDENERADCLRQVLAINPGNLAASRRLFKLIGEQEKKNPPAILTGTRNNDAYIVLLILFYGIGILAYRAVMLVYLFFFVALLFYRVYGMIKKVYIDKNVIISAPTSGMLEVKKALLVVAVQGLVYWLWPYIAPVMRTILLGMLTPSKHPY
jgi:hypothetical protein